MLAAIVSLMLLATVGCDGGVLSGRGEDTGVEDESDALDDATTPDEDADDEQVVFDGNTNGDADVGDDDGDVDAPGGDDADAVESDASLDVTDGGSDPCLGVACSGHGNCVVVNNLPTCECTDGFHSVELECVIDEACDNLTCGWCATCVVVDGAAVCQCPDGMRYDGSMCVADPDPCLDVDCGEGRLCIPSHHCMPDPVCVDTCDCSNCGNCDSTDDGRWDDWQEYCGNLNSSPATVVCNDPCPSGSGCLPYSIQYCWPMQGCFSL